MRPYLLPSFHIPDFRPKYVLLNFNFLSFFTLYVKQLISLCYLSKLFSRKRFPPLYSFHLFFSLKEVFQPHLPVRLPCYDLTPVTESTLNRPSR